MKTLTSPILTLAGGSLVLAISACSRLDQSSTGQPPPFDNNSTNTAPWNAGSSSPSGYLQSHGYSPSLFHAHYYTAPDGRGVSETTALAETHYSPPAESLATTRGGFGESGESSSAHSSGSAHGGAGE